MTELIKTPLTVIHILACVFLIIVVLLQPGKSGGLGAFTGGGAQQVFGGRGAGNFLTKTTWVTASTFFITSISLAYLSSSRDESLTKKAHAIAAAASASAAAAKAAAPSATPASSPSPAPEPAPTPEPAPAPAPASAAPASSN